MRQAWAAGEVARPCWRGVGRVALSTLALLLSLAFASSALAGPPAHQHDSALDLTGFNHACGTAVDSEGDVYVSSAGESKIRVFDPAHVELTSIPNANEPCGLAVNSKGELFVSEKATKKVVRYKPTVPYPFTGTPAYGPREEIDESGKAEGIAVDPFDDRLYVAEGNRIAMYSPAGTPGIDELQRLFTHNATGGTYTLSFEGSEPTVPLDHDADAPQIQAALENLSTIGTGNVSVTLGEFPTNRDVTFEGALGGTDVEQLQADTSGLTGSLVIETIVNGFDGHIGEGSLTNATGVAAYTYKHEPTGLTADRYVFAADDAVADQVKVFGGNDIRTLKLRKTIEGVDHDRNPVTPDQNLGFGPAGAYLAADEGYCPKEEEDPEPKQACTAGHFFVYDDAHEAVDEFEASGQFLMQIPSEEPPFSFEDAQPTAIAVDRSGGPDDGTSYVTSGASSGARALAFAPLSPPSRLPLDGPPKDLSFELQNACGMAVDKAGNRYVAADTAIEVYPPVGDTPLATITNSDRPCDLAVDSECNLYAIVAGGGAEGDEKAVLYTPKSESCPVAGTEYSGPTTVATSSNFKSQTHELQSIGINPKNGHVFVSQLIQTIELNSAKEGSKVLDDCFACFGLGPRKDIAAYGESGNVYVSAGSTVYVLDPGKEVSVVDPGDPSKEDAVKDEEVVTRISGTGSPKHLFAPNMSIAVDQRNGHVIVFNQIREVAEEYEASGTFVAQFGSFANAPRTPRIAIDNSGGPNEGNVYVAFFDDVTAFAPLSYAEPPIASTGTASEVGGGNATLNGTVDPRGFEVEECRFEYLTDLAYEENLEAEDPPFEGAEEVPCVPNAADIGSGTGPVAVHAGLTDLDPEGRYRFRLVAVNEHGTSEGQAGLFGPPVITTEPAQPVTYAEATLRARIDPSGLETRYRFEYGLSAEYGATTSEATLQPGAGPTEIEVPIFGLQEGTTYHFRVLAENEAKALAGPDQTLKTPTRPKKQDCPNQEFRTGPSAKLPDCRAYELVTPADTRGATPYQTPGRRFSDWLVAPRGEGASGRLTFFIDATLPGFEGSGLRDGYRAERTKDEGLHPAQGWTSELIAPSYLQAGGDQPAPRGVASDQLHSFWDIAPFETLEGTLAKGFYLRTPAGFEPVAKGSLGTDLGGEGGAEGRFISAGGAHVIFFSEKHLEEDSAPEGTKAIYDRAAGASSASVVSVKPDGTPFGTGEDAEYIATNEDGSAVVFKVGEVLYLHREGQTTEVATAPNTFAGISEDGSRLFYTDASDGDIPGQLFVFDVDSQAASPIAGDSVFVNVSADGSHVYFTSKEVLDDAEEGVLSADNLYLWDGVETRFIAILDPEDVGGSDINLLRWSYAIGPITPEDPFRGRSFSPTRSTPTGEVFVFESHAQLTSYDNTEATAEACGNPEKAGDRCAEVYRYDTGDDSLLCVSCDPGARPNGDATLADLTSLGTPVAAQALIPNVTDDGQAVFFGSKDSLLPEDANSVRDVYEWKAPGEGEAGSCELQEGCLALISSGQGERDSFLYGMTPDGHDVFFSTFEKLHGADITGSLSIYDARVGGGIPDPPVVEDCQGDACRGQGATPPALPAPTSTGSGDGNVKEGRPRPPCPKGKRKVRRKGKVRCVKRHRKQSHGKQRQKRRHGKGRAAR